MAEIEQPRPWLIKVTRPHQDWKNRDTTRGKLLVSVQGRLFLATSLADEVKDHLSVTLESPKGSAGSPLQAEWLQKDVTLTALGATEPSHRYAVADPYAFWETHYRDGEPISLGGAQLHLDRNQRPISQQDSIGYWYTISPIADSSAPPQAEDHVQ